MYPCTVSGPENRLAARHKYCAVQGTQKEGVSHHQLIPMHTAY